MGHDMVEASSHISEDIISLVYTTAMLVHTQKKVQTKYVCMFIIFQYTKFH